MAAPKSGPNLTPLSVHNVLPGPRGGDLRAALDAEVSEERSYATEKKWSARRGTLPSRAGSAWIEIAVVIALVLLAAFMAV